MICFLIALTVALALTSFFRGTIDNPTRRGGVAVSIALLVAVATREGLSIFRDFTGYWVGSGIVFGMGLMDDFRPLPAVTKLFVQIAAGAAFLFWLTDYPNCTSLLMLIVAFVWIIGITNGLNLLDNMDGLTSGIGAIAALGLASLGLGSHDILLALAGALLGFLIDNFHPARIYLGDSGSYLVGFSLAAVPSLDLKQENFWMLPLILLAPIVDTGFVAISRWRRGVSPFTGGKDHISHQMVKAGFSVRQVVLLFYLVGLGLVVLCHGLNRFVRI